MKCLICKVVNATLELKRHPNAQTLFIVKSLLARVRRKDPKDINKICEGCRVPIRFNNILVAAGESISTTYKVKNQHVNIPKRTPIVVEEDF